MRNYDEELLNKITVLEDEVKKMEIINGLNMICDLIRESGLETDPRYKEGSNKIVSGLGNYTNLTAQLKARVWQKNDIIEQIRKTKIGRYLLSKCKTKETF